jgi:hypothetical protein
MSMDAFLAEHYGTNKTASASQPSQDDLQKQASVELFLKLASEQNIDLNSMPDAQVEQLYSNWVKQASEEEEPASHEKKKVEEEAKKEHEEKKAAAEKFAEADFLGRTMAHALVDEMKKIAAEGGSPFPFGGHGKDEKKDEKKEEHKHPPEKSKEEEKKASAIDRLAVQTAAKLAQAAGLDPAEAQARTEAILTLNLAPQSIKVASADTVDAAIEIRALELLETAGYPVTWK